METTDIWFAAVLRINGYKLKKCRKFERGKGAFVFEISEADWEKEKIAFLNSEACRIKSETTSLKDLLY